MAAAPRAQHVLRRLKTNGWSLQEKSNEQALESKRSNGNLAAPVRIENRRTERETLETEIFSAERRTRRQNPKWENPIPGRVPACKWAEV
jgi:hypothetical protein